MKKRKVKDLGEDEQIKAAALEASLFHKDTNGALENTIGNELNKSAYGKGLFEFSPHSQDEDAQRPNKQTPPPLWDDPEDADVRITITKKSMLRKLRQSEEEVQLTGKEYEERLRQQHKKLHAKASSWATLKKTSKSKTTRPTTAPDTGDEHADNEESILESFMTRAGGIFAQSKKQLPSSRIETTRLQDANLSDPSQSVVTSVEFHPGGQLLMAAGLDRHLRFYNIDGLQNPHVQSLYLEDMPVHTAAFSSGGAHVIAAGRRSFFYVLDLESGKIDRIASIFGRTEKSFETFATSTSSSTIAFFGRDGSIPLVSTSSRQLMGTLKMNGTARAGTFSVDGNELLTSGGDGSIYVWDMRMQRCRSTYVDEGSIGGASLAASPDGALFASGATTGIVNVYKHPDSAGGVGNTSDNNMETRRGSISKDTWINNDTLLDGGSNHSPRGPTPLRPLRALSHLTTTADSLSFNSDGQILAVASRMKRDSLRLVHVPSLTVFSNWPTNRSPLHYVHSLCFSPGGGYLCIGNAKGRVILYRLHHYPQA